MFNFHTRYFILTLILFLIEVLIGIYAHDVFIRPFGGDFLVVILIYCFLKSFVNIPSNTIAICVLIFSYLVEASQYFHLIDVLGLENSMAARLILGTFFSWIDILMYTLGMGLVLIVETTKNKNGTFRK